MTAPAAVVPLGLANDAKLLNLHAGELLAVCLAALSQLATGTAPDALRAHFQHGTRLTRGAMPELLAMCGACLEQPNPQLALVELAQKAADADAVATSAMLQLATAYLGERYLERA